MIGAAQLGQQRFRDRVKAYTPAGVIDAYRVAKRAATYVPRQALGTITRVNTREPAVAVTFDDGPDPRYTPLYLELLERHGARGTFFLVGQSAQKHPALVQRIRAGGHALGNHSWDHSSFPAISSARRRDQIRACEAAIGPVSPKLFRPPFGNQTLATRLDLRWLGWDVVAWDVCATDWLDDSAEVMATRITDGLRPGSIVLMHDTLHQYEQPQYASRAASVQALALVLERMQGRYRFVTVPELLRLGRPQRELWRQPGDAGYLARLQGGQV